MPVCNATLDVVIILDGSNSIITADWYRALAFANTVVDSFNVSATEVEIGALQFSESATQIVPISPYPQVIKNKISSTRQDKLNTNTYDGFKLAQTMFQKEGRATAKGKICILITDGAQNEGLPASIVSNQMKAAGTEIFGIGVGSAIDVAELTSWVSTPIASHYFPVTGFDALQKVLKSIIDNACPHPPVPVTAVA